MNALDVKPNSSYQNFNQALGEIDRTSKKLKNDKKTLVSFKDIVDTSFAELGRLKKLKSEIEVIQPKREAFLEKYLNVRWKRVAIRITGIALITLGVALSWFIALSAVDFMRFAVSWHSFGLNPRNDVSLVAMCLFNLTSALASPLLVSVGLLASLCVVGVGAWMAFAPKHFVESMAPSSHHQEEERERIRTSVSEKLGISTEELDLLCQSLESIENLEDRKNFLISNVPLLREGLEALAKQHS